MDDSKLVEFFTDILSHTVDKQLNLENLIGHHTQLKKKNPSFCMSKAELKKFFQKYNFIFKIDNKEVVHLLESNVASHHNSKQNTHTICDSKGSNHASLDGAAESVQESDSATSVPTLDASRSSSCQRTSRLSSRESSLNRFGSQSSLCSSVTSAASSVIGTSASGIIDSLQPKFGFIKADEKYNLEGFVYFGLHNVTNYGYVQSLTDFFENGQRVRFTIAAPTHHPATYKWAAKDITSENIDSDSSSEVNEAESPSKRLCISENDSDSASDTREIKGGHGVIENLFDTYGFIRQDETNKYCGNVFFPYRTVKGVPVGKSAKEVLEVGTQVTFDAETSLKKGSRARWLAVCVWINQKFSLEKQNCLEDVYVSEDDDEDSEWSLDKPLNNGSAIRNLPWNVRQKKTNESGRIYSLNSTEALIKFGEDLDKIAFAISKVVYVGGSLVDDLIWCVNDGSRVTFNAISDQDCPAGYEWKATLVTVGSQMITGKPDAAQSDKVWDELIIEYRTTKSVEEKVKQSTAVAATSYVPSLPGVESDGHFYESEDQLVKQGGGGNWLTNPDDQSVKQLSAAKVVFQATDEITPTNVANPLKVSRHYDDSLSETSSQSEVLQPKDQVSSRVGRITSIQKYYLKITCIGLAKPLPIFWNDIYVHGQCAENIYANLQKGPFKKGDMINFYLANNDFIALAWLGKKPKTINMKNVQNGEDGESSVPVTYGSSYSSCSSAKHELVTSTRNDMLSENKVDIVFERASASLGNWKDVKGADGVCYKNAFISGERGTVLRVIANKYGFIKQESTPKGRKKSAVYFQKNVIRNWPRGARRLEEILKDRDHVWYVAIPREKEKAKSQWLALHVWISPCCRNNTCYSKAEVKAQDEWLIENAVPWLERFKVFGKKGTLYPHSLTEATIVGEGNERVLALRSVVFGSDYQMLDDKLWILASRSKVTYNAISDGDCPACFNWKATVVCLDDKIPPSIPDASCDQHLWSELMCRIGGSNLCHCHITIRIARTSVSHCVADHSAAHTTVEDYIFSDLLPRIATCILENIISEFVV